MFSDIKKNKQQIIRDEEIIQKSELRFELGQIRASLLERFEIQIIEIPRIRIS